MTDTPQEWPRAQRLDAERLTSAVRELTGSELTVAGPCPGGQVGATYVRGADGRRSVLKWRPRTTVQWMRSGPLAVCEALRRAGYPAPAHEVVVQVGDAVVTVQELLPGAPLDRVDHAHLDQVLDLNESQAEALSAHRDVPSGNLHLRGDGDGYCLHGPLRRHRGRTAVLEGWIRSVGDTYGEVLAGDDAVHYDFQPANLLVRDGVVTGVIDWDGATRGDRRLDLVTLRFGLHAVDTAPGVVERVDALLDTFPAHVLRPAWAHMSLRMVDWAVRHFTPADVTHWLDLAERRTD